MRIKNQLKAPVLILLFFVCTQQSVFAADYYVSSFGTEKYIGSIKDENFLSGFGIKSYCKVLDVFSDNSSCVIKDGSNPEIIPKNISAPVIKEEKTIYVKNTSVPPISYEQLYKKLYISLVAYIDLQKQTVPEKIKELDKNEKSMVENKKLEDNVYRVAGYGGWYPSYTNPNVLVGISTIGYLNGTTIENANMTGNTNISGNAFIANAFIT